MTSVHQQLLDMGIDVGSKLGHVRLKCPQCSADRKKKYRSDLSLEVSAEGAKGWCHHCSLAINVGVNTSTKKVFTKPEYTPTEELDPKVVAWFASRGITEDVLKRNKIGYVQTWMPNEDKEVGAITFPYFRNGEVVNVKYRSGNKDFKMERGAELILYKSDDIQSDTLIWVEGEIDALSVEVVGLTNCVSVPGGAPNPGAKTFDSYFAYLETTDLSAVTKHIIAVDSDAPGRALKAELIRRLGPESCYFVEWPEDAKDANDCLVKYGRDTLREYLDNPKAVPIAGVVEANDLRNEVLDLYDNGHPPGANPGSIGLGHFYTVQLGQLSIVTGATSHGKSSVVDWVTYSLAADLGWRFGVCSPENHPIAEHIIKLIELRAGQKFSTIPRSDIPAYTDWVHDHFTFISPEADEEWSIPGVIKIAKSVIRRKGIKGLILDPVNEFMGYRDTNLSETEYVSRTLSELRRFARNYGTHVWLVAHPTKLFKGEDGQFPVPNLYQISGSAHYANKCDFGISVWRDPTDHGSPTTVDVQKVRFKRDGMVGTHLMQFDYHSNRFSDFNAY